MNSFPTPAVRVPRRWPNDLTRVGDCRFGESVSHGRRCAPAGRILDPDAPNATTARGIQVFRHSHPAVLPTWGARVVVSCLLSIATAKAEDPASAGRAVFQDGFEQQLSWRAWPGGRQSGRIVPGGPDRGAGALGLGSGPKPILYVYIDVLEHTRYTVSFWLKGRDLAGRFGLNLNFNRKGGGNGSAGRETVPMPIPGRKGEWTQLRASFVTPPAAVTLQLGLDLTHMSGEVWLDDVIVREDEVLRGPQHLVPFLKTTMPKVAADRAAFLFSASADHVASASPDMPSMIAFKTINGGHKPRLFLDLPCGFELLSGIRYLTISPPAQIRRGEQAFARYTVTQSRPGGWFRLFWATSLAPGETTSAFYWAEWDGGRQEETRLPVEIVSIPAVSPPRRLTTYLSVPCDLAAAWPDYGHYCRLGLNTLDIWPYTRDRSAWAIRILDNVMRKTEGKGIALGAWPGEWWWREARSKDTDAQAVLIDGGKTESLCPSYRGPHFREVVEHGTFLVDREVFLHVFDPEIYRDGDRICFCQRCQNAFEAYWAEHHPQTPFLTPAAFEQEPEKHPEHHAAWAGFKAALYAGCSRTTRGGSVSTWNDSGPGNASSSWPSRPTTKTGIRSSATRTSAIPQFTPSRSRTLWPLRTASTWSRRWSIPTSTPRTDRTTCSWAGKMSEPGVASSARGHALLPSSVPDSRSTLTTATSLHA